ncbi:Neurofilament heavy polypeptide [Bienertia sinuspersici]
MVSAAPFTKVVIGDDVYFDDESAEVVISSLRLGNDQESSLASPSPVDEETGGVSSSNTVNASDDLIAMASSQVPETEMRGSISEEDAERGTTDEKNDWVEWRETSNSGDISDCANKQGAATNEIDELSNKVEESCPSAPEVEQSPLAIDDAPERNDAGEDEGKIAGALSSSSSNTPKDEIQSSDATLGPKKDEIQSSETARSPTNDETQSSDADQSPKKDEIQSSEAEQSPKKDENEKTDLVQSGN